MFQRRFARTWLILSLALIFTLSACSQPEAATTNEAAPAEDTSSNEVVEIEAPTEDEDAEELAGEIVISLDSSDVQTYEALANAYMALHPKVKVLVELKASSGDSSYLQKA